MRLFLSCVLLSAASALGQVGPPATETPESLYKKAAAVLPQLDGELKLPGVREPVEVQRDKWGVPHIYAKNTDDLFFAQGFVAAQDRLFQLDWWRRVAVGETAEVLGPEAVPADTFARLLLYRGDMKAEWASYSPDTQRIATAFTDGINAYIDHVQGKLPVEFQILGHAPKNWRPEDCLGRMSGIVMSRNFQSEILRAQLIARLGLEKTRQLAPGDPPHAFSLAPGLDLAGIDSSVLAGYAAATRSPAFQLPATESNNWVIDGTLSASGKPLLASDPHRAITVPSLRYLVHLNAPGWNVIGAGEPALPGVALGHNDHVAWGITIVTTDQADVYVEDTRPDHPAEYKVGAAWEKMKTVREKIAVRGQKQPVEVELRFTRHGPVIHQDAARHRAFALRWAGSEPGGAAYLGGLAVSRARNKAEFLAALRSWKIPALNFVYADKDDTIGWVAGGLTPVRKGWDGLLPVPGAAGDYEWQGFLDVKDLPQSFNPSNHWLATANHNILPAGYQHEISYEFGANYRFTRIKQRLEAQKKFDLNDFQSIQKEWTSLPGQALVRLLKEVGLPDPVLAPYVKMFTGWNGVLTRETPAGPLYAAWLRELQDAFYGAHLGKETALLEGVRGLGGLPVMFAALEKPDKTWFGTDPQAERDRLVRNTFAVAVTKVKKLLGDNPATWSWGKLHTVTFRHPLSHLGPAYAKAFDLGLVPRGGDAQTPNNTRHDDHFQQVHGASYRQLLDLADWDRGLATSAPGQSGQLASPHYADLMPLWAEGQYFPLAFSRKKVEDVTQHRLVLKPVGAKAGQAGDPPKSIRIVGLTVTKPASKEAGDPVDAFDPGTHIDLIVHRPGKRLLELDIAASKLILFTDDLKTDLSKTDILGWLTDVHSGISSDGTRLGFRIRSPAVPAAGATLLYIKGTIALKAGSDEMTAEAKKLMLKDNSSTKVGPFTASLAKSVFEGKPVVRITHDQPNVKHVKFFNVKGEVIPSRSAGRQSWSTNGQPPTYLSDYLVEGPLENISIQVRYYSKIEIITEPLDLKIGLGF
jgi:penicillin amidase